MAEAPYRIGISGSYGGLNLGDEAILQSILAQLRATLTPAPLEITVFSRNAADTLRRHKVERAVPVRDLTRDEVCREIAGLDLFILGGGGILFDAEASMFLREFTIAREQGVPGMVYAVSAGPLATRSAQEQVREALARADVVTVRDRGAKRTLEEIGVSREIEVTADPALLIEPEALPPNALLREGLEGGSAKLVGMSVREPGPAAPDIDREFYHALLADAADFIIDRYDANIVFIPMERSRLDMQHSHAVIARMLRPQRASVLKGSYTPGQILSIMRGFEFAVGMRLHFLIFAAIAGVPFVALPYSPKVQGLLDDLQLVMPPMHLVNAGRLIAHIDQFWDARKPIRQRIEHLLPGIKERARRTNALATELLRRGRDRKSVPPEGCRA